MPDQKISQLTDGGASQATDEYVIARSGSNFRIDGASVAAAATSVGTLSSLTVSGNTIVGAEVFRGSDSSFMRIAGGNPSATGAAVVLFGSTHATAPGRVDINAVGATGTVNINTNGASPALTVTAAGNLGLGVTPSAWTTFKVFQSQRSAFASYSDGSPNAATVITTNAFYDGSWKYIQSIGATSYEQATSPSSAHKWFVAANGTAGNAITFTQAMTLDASGNLGVGETSPGQRLVVRNTSAAPYVSIIAGDSSVMGILMGKASNTVDGQILYSNSTQAMQFVTASSERARITSGGNLLVGTTAAAAGERLHVKSAGNTAATYNCFFANSDAALVFNFEDAGKFRTGTLADSPYNYTVGGTNRDLFVDSSGYIGYVSSVLASKTNIIPVTDVDWLLALNPVTFNFRKKDEDGQYTDEADGPIKHGLIAEEVEAVNADLCFYDDEANGGALRGVNYSHLITPMLKLIQTQQSRIEALEARLEALEA